MRPWPSKRHKYGVSKAADRTNADGTLFDSRGEMLRWEELRLMERGGLISCLRRQVRFRFEVPGIDGRAHHLCDYVADFRYEELDRSTGRQVDVIEDFKSAETRKQPMYRLKAKLMLIIYGINIRETTRERRR